MRNLTLTTLLSHLYNRLLFLVYNVIILSGSTALMVLFITHGFTSNVPESLRLTLSITQGLLLFWVISILFLTTCAPFFFGECRLRWKYGFKPTEVIIRRSPPESLTAHRSNELSTKHWHASLRAINPTLLYTNPASTLATDFWVLEYAIIMDVYAGMSEGQINEEDLEFTAWKEYSGVWTGLELWRLHSIVSDQQEVALFRVGLRHLQLKFFDADDHISSRPSSRTRENTTFFQPGNGYLTTRNALPYRHPKGINY